MNQEDIYKDKLKALFSEYESPIPGGGWDRLEQSLDASKKAYTIRRRWYIGSAAAVVVLLITSVLFLNLPKQQSVTDAPYIVAIDEQKDLMTNDYEESFQSISADSRQTDLKIKKGHNNKKEFKKETQTTKRNSSLLASRGKISDANSGDLHIFKELDEVSDIHHNSAEKSSKDDIQLSQEEVDRLIADFENAGNINIFNEHDSKRKSPITLAMSTGGALSASRTVANNPMRLRSVINDDASSDTNGKGASSVSNNQLMGNNMLYNATNVSDNKAELNHYQPVSFGITVSKVIHERLSVETGLVYTYLYSKSKNNSSSFSNKETQNFHYLGVPLNFNYYFLNIGDLGLFATIGGMVEKDIYGDYQSMGESVPNESRTEAREMITKKISQKNPQFSVNAGFGASYPIYRGFSLYGRFGGTYYFDANNYEYKTIYSDKKIMLDLNVGVRFDF